MKITLDHNCIIDLANKNSDGALIGAIVRCNNNQCFVVNIGASEKMRARGVRPDRYDKFEELLIEAQIDHLPRIDPMLIVDVTFLGRCIIADDAMIQLADNIEAVLFNSRAPLMPSEGLDSPTGNKWLNRLCDVHSLWCHIYNKHDVFLTRDDNFMKPTKLPKLRALGARKICRPAQL
jgi:hypothetical protein